MKAKLNKRPVVYTPITLEIAIESQEEHNFMIELFGRINNTTANEIADMAMPNSLMLNSIYLALIDDDPESNRSNLVPKIPW